MNRGKKKIGLEDFATVEVEDIYEKIREGIRRSMRTELVFWMQVIIVFLCLRTYIYIN